jgi:peptidoglycan/xylan/chitin deacetylase (PgdA/CDA1 family)
MSAYSPIAEVDRSLLESSREPSVRHDVPEHFGKPDGHRRDGSLPAMIAGKVTRFLSRNIRTKRLAMRNEQPLVSFTFDDVPASTCSVGVPILEQYGIRGTFYISGGGCGTPSPCGPLATADQLKLLHAKGHELACHTFTHFAVSRVGADDLVRDLERNRAFLTGISGEAPHNFAYPYGDMSFLAKRYLEGRFDSCRSIIPALNSGSVDLGALRAWPLENVSMDRGKILDLMVMAARTRGWLVFFSHDVSEQPSKFGVTPDLLAFAAASARDAGCRIVTVAEGHDIAAGGQLV